MFESTAVAYFTAMDEVSSSGNVIVSGDGIIALWKLLNPNASEMHSPFVQTSLQGVYVPDGVMINARNKLVGVIEAKASLTGSGVKSLKQQIEAFHFGRKKFSNLYEDPTLYLFENS